MKRERVFLILNSSLVFGIRLWWRLYWTGRGELLLENNTMQFIFFLKDILGLVLESFESVLLPDF